MITEALKAVSHMMSSTPLLTRMSLSHRFGRKHEVMSSMLIAHIHCGIHSEGCADWRSEVFRMKAVPETRTGRVPSNTRVLRPCSRITLRYNRKRQHTHGGRALCEPCGLGHSDRKTGRVGMLFSTWRPFLNPPCAEWSQFITLIKLGLREQRRNSFHQRVTVWLLHLFIHACPLFLCTWGPLRSLMGRPCLCTHEAVANETFSLRRLRVQTNRDDEKNENMNELDW